jgi:selenocysteine lyase/cysteine desulfurase
VREHALAKHLRARLPDLEGVQVYGPAVSPSIDVARYGLPVAPLISFAVQDLASAQVARILDREFNIAARAGLHCAPEAHRVAGTLSTGLVRLSIGHSTTKSDVEAVTEALAETVSKPASYWLTEWETHHAR